MGGEEGAQHKKPILLWNVLPIIATLYQLLTISSYHQLLLISIVTKNNHGVHMQAQRSQTVIGYSLLAMRSCDR